MIRRPTSHEQQYRWHSEMLKGALGDVVETVNDQPECGWFKRRLVKGGPFVPAKIWLVQFVDDDGELLQDEFLQCEVNGQYAEPDDAWPWLCGNPISEAEFDYLTAATAYAADYAPDEPMANPYQAVDWLNVPTPVFERMPHATGK
jgi:hypothetical protein